MAQDDAVIPGRDREYWRSVYGLLRGVVEVLTHRYHEDGDKIMEHLKAIEYSAKGWREEIAAGCRKED